TASALARSAAMLVRRLPSRSMTDPPRNAPITPGRTSAAPTMPVSSGVPRDVSTSHGRAIAVSSFPTSEIDVAAHSATNGARSRRDARDDAQAAVTLRRRLGARHGLRDDARGDEDQRQAHVPPGLVRLDDIVDRGLRAGQLQLAPFGELAALPPQFVDLIRVDERLGEGDGDNPNALEAGIDEATPKLDAHGRIPDLGDGRRVDEVHGVPIGVLDVRAVRVDLRTGDASAWSRHPNQLANGRVRLRQVHQQALH